MILDLRQNHKREGRVLGGAFISNPSDTTLVVLDVYKRREDLVAPPGLIGPRPPAVVVVSARSSPAPTNTNVMSALRGSLHFRTGPRLSPG